MPKSGSTQDLADYLVNGFWRATGWPTHSWDKPGNVITFNVTGLDADARQMARQAFDAWASVADLHFKEVTKGGNIVLDDNGSGANTYPNFTRGGGDMVSAHVVIGSSFGGSADGVGTYRFHTFMHEIGHALGLGHAGAYNGGASYSSATWTNDSWQQSVMSYLDQDENPNVAAPKTYIVSPMMADILAIQKIYGVADGGATAGNTVYGPRGNTGTYLDAFFAGRGGSLAHNAVTIFDEGGRDTIDLSRDTKAENVDLSAGKFSDVFGRIDNLAISTKTVIENFVAGSGSDTVRGNAAGNALTLNAGNDTASGLGGNDVLRGGLGQDRLSGGDGADRLDGGAGDDRLSGGAGSDTFDFGDGRDTVLDFQNDVDTIRLNDALWGGASRSVSQVLSTFAEVSQGDVVFDFGHGDTLTIRDVSSLRALANDLAIV